jgi:hypothetical protein
MGGDFFLMITTFPLNAKGLVSRLLGLLTKLVLLCEHGAVVSSQGFPVPEWRMTVWLYQRFRGQSGASFP